jgi:hypothetical protein
MDAFTASIPVAAYRATAMTAEQIDAHPDAATLGSADRVMISTLGGNLVVSGHGWEASAQSAEIDVDADVHAQAAQMFSRGIITTALGRIKGAATVKIGPTIVRIDHEGENAGVTLAFGQRVPGNVSIGDAVAA